MITEKPMLPPDKVHQLAMCLQAIEDLERGKKDFLKDFAARMEALQMSAWKLRTEILTGQKSLLDPPEAAA